MSMRSLKLANIILVLLFGASCATAPSAVLKKSALDGNTALATDSRLRVVTNTEIGTFSISGLVDPNTIVCAEPSPDVATALANSVGVGISIFGQGSASLSAQQIEGLIQLGERTASIQLLRDKMYQTCLAYANGAISGTTYSLIMSRLDDTIVTLLLGETAAGASGRKLGGIGTNAGAETSADYSGLPGEMADIEEAAKLLAVANENVDQAAADLDALKNTKAEEGKEAEHRNNIELKEEDLAKAKGERRALLELVRGKAESIARATGQVSLLESGGALDRKPDPRVAETMSNMQTAFLRDDVTKNYVSACLVELGLREGPNAKESAMNTLEYEINVLREELGAQSMIARYSVDDPYYRRTPRTLSDQQQEVAKDTLARLERLREQELMKQLNPSEFDKIDESSMRGLAREARKRWLAEPEAFEYFIGYASAVQRSRGSRLAQHCVTHLPNIISDSLYFADRFRRGKAELDAKVELARSNADYHAARAADIEITLRAVKDCEIRFKSETQKQKACFERFLLSGPGISDNEPVRDGNFSPRTASADVPAQAPVQDQTLKKKIEAVPPVPIAKPVQ